MGLNCVYILKVPVWSALSRTLWVWASGDVSARQPSLSVKILTNRG
jgi:hypothetical protein